MVNQNRLSPIRFGTDGWRAIIADTFTFENVRVIGQAVAEYLWQQQLHQQGIAIGYDTRFLSERFAETLAETLAANKVPVFLSERFCPTPVLSFAVRHHTLAAGIMVTASHNPFYYNGIKFKAYYGGPALPEMTRAIEKNLFLHSAPRSAAEHRQFIVRCDFFPEYFQHFSQHLVLAVVQRYSGQVFYDAMHGAGGGYLEKILSLSGALSGKRKPALKLSAIHQKPHPQFGGLLPEPIPQNLTALCKLVRRNEDAIGLATDGDADRFGVIDDKGNFVQLHDLLPLMVQYLIQTRGWSGDIVRTTSMADTVDKMAAKLSRKTIEVPVGFKNITERMLAQDVLIGGEESGGFGFKNHLPERDGIYSCLLLLEMLAADGISIRKLVQQLRREFGPFAYGRIDRYGQLDLLRKKMAVLRRQPPERVGDFKVASINLIDGIKLYFDDGSWMLVRVSDTEPLYRLYVGSDKEDKVQVILSAGERLMEN